MAQKAPPPTRSRPPQQAKLTPKPHQKGATGAHLHIAPDPAGPCGARSRAAQRRRLLWRVERRFPARPGFLSLVRVFSLGHWKRWRAPSRRGRAEGAPGLPLMVETGGLSADRGLGGDARTTGGVATFHPGASDRWPTGRREPGARRIRPPPPCRAPAGHRSGVPSRMRHGDCHSSWSCHRPARPPRTTAEPTPPGPHATPAHQGGHWRRAHLWAEDPG